MATVEADRVQSMQTTEYAGASTLRSSPIFRQYVRPCCAEILGTIIFTFASNLSVIADSKSLTVSLAQGATIFALYGSLGSLSGGHYNPSVSLASWLGGGVTFVTMLFYMVCQILGAFIGSLLFRTVLLRSAYLIAAPYTVPAVNFSYTTIGQAILIETIGTCMWSLAVLQTTVDGSRSTQLAASYVGSAVFAASLFSYNLTKASLNPAKALGTTLAYTVFADGDWFDHYVFWIGPFLGAIVAIFLYRLILANDDKRLLFKK